MRRVVSASCAYSLPPSLSLSLSLEILEILEGADRERERERERRRLARVARAAAKLSESCGSIATLLASRAFPRPFPLPAVVIRAKLSARRLADSRGAAGPSGSRLSRKGDARNLGDRVGCCGEIFQGTTRPRPRARLYGRIAPVMVSSARSIAAGKPRERQRASGRRITSGVNTIALISAELHTGGNRSSINSRWTYACTCVHARPDLRTSSRESITCRGDEGGREAARRDSARLRCDTILISAGPKSPADPRGKDLINDPSVYDFCYCRHISSWLFPNLFPLARPPPSRRRASSELSSDSRCFLRKCRPE